MLLALVFASFCETLCDREYPLHDQAHTLFATLQLADSFFPTGLFTQSHGLESFVAAGTTGAAQIEALLHSYVLHVAAPGDALAVRWVTRAAQVPIQYWRPYFRLLVHADQRM
jgi:urease accessory protein UreF